jgi:hypothetical protein
MMIDDFGDSKITVQKAELLAKIKINRTQHKAEYDEAVAKYRAAATVELAKQLETAQNGGEIKTNLNLVVPFENLKDYDRVIAMLEMSTADSILITESQFSKYALDEWNWQAQFKTTNSTYNHR